MRSSGCHRGDDRLGTNRDVSPGLATGMGHKNSVIDACTVEIENAELVQS